MKIVSLLDGLFSKAAGHGRLNGGLACADQKKKYLRERWGGGEGCGGSFQCAFFKLVQSNFKLRYILEPCEHIGTTLTTLRSIGLEAGGGSVYGGRLWGLAPFCSFCS